MSETFTNVARFLPEMASSNPDQCAVVSPHSRHPGSSLPFERRTFGELNADCDAVARLLAAHGVCRNMRVLLMVKPGLDLILVTFALFKIGATPIIIDPGMGFKQFLRCVQNTQPEALIAVPLGQYASRIFFRKFRSVRIHVTVGTGAFVRQVTRHRRALKEIGPFPVAATASDDLAAILFTSGSTGPPKGVCYEHGTFDAQIRLIRQKYGIEPGEIDMPMLPVFALFNPALGMTTVVPRLNPSRPATVDPAVIVEAIRQFEVTNSFGSPAIWNRIGSYCISKGITLPTVRRILIAGAPVSPALLRLFLKILPNGVIHTPFGATECLPVTSISGSEVLDDTWQQTERGKGTCVGNVMPEVTVRVMAIEEKPVAKFDQIRELPTGEIGEIIVKGPVVTRRYDRSEQETISSRIYENDGVDGVVWHRMGDLGAFDDQGRLWFCGRKAERVSTAQGDLFTDCCEAIYNSHPDVYRSALIGHGPDKQIPAIVVEPVKGKFPKSSRARRQFADALRALGAKHEHTRDIQHYYFHDNFPVDVRHNAKINRLMLAKMF